LILNVRLVSYVEVALLISVFGIQFVDVVHGTLVFLLIRILFLVLVNIDYFFSFIGFDLEMLFGNP